MLLLLVVKKGHAFTSSSRGRRSCYHQNGIRSALIAAVRVPSSSSSSLSSAAPASSSTKLFMSQITEREARTNIDKVVAALRKDKQANEELGRIQGVNNILGFGSPKVGQVAVRFNASFKKGGMGRAAIPLPFGLGQTNESEGRGVMVGQVKASVDSSTGKVVSCSVFRDLGYGRSFELKC